MPDAAAEGITTVQNGLSLCSLHHAAYDRNILRIDPDYVINVEREWIREGDRFAKAALTDFEGRSIVLPRSSEHHPNRDFLARRFED